MSVCTALHSTTLHHTLVQLDEFKSWLEEALANQTKKTDHEDPAFTMEQLKATFDKVLDDDRVCTGRSENPKGSALPSVRYLIGACRA